MKIAEAFVEIRADMDKLKGDLDKAVSSSRSAAGKMSDALGKVGGVVSASFSKAFGVVRSVLSGILKWVKRLTIAIGVGLVASIKLASDSAEGLSRFQAVFRDLTDDAEAFAQSLGQAVGRSVVELRDSLATFQSFFVGMGFVSDEAKTLSEQMSKLALDFASFNNLSDSEAVERFISAMSGSSEVLAMFGINIKQAALDQQLLAMGFKDGAAKADEQLKAVARYAIIMKSMTDQGAVGDAVRTAGSFANQLKRLRGNLIDVAVAVGDVIIGGESASGMLSRINDEMASLSKWIRTNADGLRRVLAGAFSVVSTAIATLSNELSAMLPSVDTLGLSFESLEFKIRATMINIEAEIKKFPAAIRAALQEASDVVNFFAQESFKGPLDQVIESITGIRPSAILEGTRQFNKIKRGPGPDPATIETERATKLRKLQQEKEARGIMETLRGITDGLKSLGNLRGGGSGPSIGDVIANAIAQSASDIENAPQRLASTVGSIQTATGSFKSGGAGIMLLRKIAKNTADTADAARDSAMEFS